MARGSADFWETEAGRGSGLFRRFGPALLLLHRVACGGRYSEYRPVRLANKMPVPRIGIYRFGGAVRRSTP